MSDLRIAVVGAGKFGQNHVRILSEMEGVELVAVCDQNAERVQEVTGKHGGQALGSYKEALDLCDGAVVVTPTITHSEIVSAFLNAGKPAFVEKPMTTTVEEADALAELVEKTGLFVQVGHIERFNPIIRASREHITAPRFISVERLSPFPMRSLDVDVVMDLMIHDLDLVRMFVADEVTNIQAAGAPILSKEIDMVSARIEFATGAIANITTSRVSLKRTRNFRLFLADKYLSLDLLEHKGLIAWAERAGSTDPEAMPEVAFEEISAAKSNPLREELAAFCESIRTSKTPEVDVHAGREAVVFAGQVLDAIKAHHDRSNFPVPQPGLAP